MSNKKKPKKLRTPNVVAQTATTATGAAPAETRRAGPVLASPSRLERVAPAATTSNFDYTYVKKDLSRIGVLAASFIVALVVLSFFIH